MTPTVFPNIENSKELIDGMLKAGLMVFMIENKKLNAAAFFALLLENNSYQEFFDETR